MLSPDTIFFLYSDYSPHATVDRLAAKKKEREFFQSWANASVEPSKNTLPLIVDERVYSWIRTQNMPSKPKKRKYLLIVRQKAPLSQSTLLMLYRICQLNISCRGKFSRLRLE